MQRDEIFGFLGPNTLTFVVNLIGTLASGGAVMRRRTTAMAANLFTLVKRVQSAAEAQFHETGQTPRQRLDETEKQLRSSRSGGTGPDGRIGVGPCDGAEADGAPSSTVVRIDGRPAIDMARQDIIPATRGVSRAAQLALDHDISALRNRPWFFTVILLPASLSVPAWTMSLALRRRRAKTRP